MNSDSKSEVMERQTEAGGIKIHVFEGGKGTPLVFFHGAAGIRAWPPYLEALSQRHRIWAPSHPGFGHSDDATEDMQTVAQVAAFYQCWVKEQGIERFHLIGSSLGAWMASEFAAIDDSALLSLTLIAPPGLCPKPKDTPPPGQTAEEYAIRKLFLNQTIADQWLTAKPSDEQKHIMARNRSATARYAGPLFFNPELKSALASVTVPTLIVWGDSDAVVPVEQAEDWGKAIQNSQIEIIEECGHLPHMECTDLTLARIYAFHDSVSAQTPIDAI